MRDARGRMPAIGIPFMVVGIIVVMVVPLPSNAIDFLIAINITLAVVILLTSMMVAEPLRFSVFPSLLLVTTLFRLALNVSTTRLILSGGDSEIIRAFGGFVVGGNLVIGLVIFLTLIVIQFAVITNGAGRVAEVSARFMLDAMPGKQMAIDADLNSGLIDEHEARRRRQGISAEADFYGSMDGASKFVKGDATAGVVIVLINLIGGIGVGVLQLGLGVGEAMDRFATLTVGDGLVSQIPALLVSVASGIIVTRTVGDGSSNLGADVWGQLLQDSRILAVASAAIAMLGIVPGLPQGPFLVLAALLAVAALRQRGAETDDEPAPTEDRPEPESHDGIVSDMRVEALELELAPDLLALVDPGLGGNLLDRVRTLRRHLALELGLVAPLVRTRDDLLLPPSTYVIRVHGVEVGRGQAPAGTVLVLAASPDADVPGEPTVEPVFGLPATWVPESLAPTLEARGHSVIDHSSLLITHLSEVIRSHAAQLLSRQDVQDLVDGLKPIAPAVANEVGSELLSVAELHQVLRALLSEGVPIRDLVRILEAVTAVSCSSRDLDAMVEAARKALGPAICAAVARDGRLYAVTLDPMLEQHLLESLRPGENGAFLAVDPRLTERLLDQVGVTVGEVENRGLHPALLCSGQLRPVLRRLLQSSWPSLPVLSFSELSSSLSLESAGVIRVDAHHAAI